jgi:hypothetical protein
MTRFALLATVAGLALTAPAFASSQTTAVSPTQRGAAHLASRETQALNLLEAKGYHNFSAFHRDGGNFVAMVLEKGKPETVIIDPAAGTVTKKG